MHQIVRTHYSIDGIYLWLVSGHQHLFQRTQNDYFHCSLESVHLHVIKYTAALLKQSVLFEFDPEVVLDGEQEDIALEVS